MSRGGRAQLFINHSKVDANLQLLIQKVGRGTKKATQAAVDEILEESLKQVPKDTETLAKSGYTLVDGYYKTGFAGVVGYGGNGDPANPRTGQPASRYMVEVHEDLSVHHPNGKAKFLEDPLVEFQKRALNKYGKFIKSETGI